MPAPDISIRVDGLDTLRKQLRAADKALAKELGQAGKEAADIVARAAKPKVPVLTGRARDSVRATVLKGGGAVKGGGTKAPYFGFLDYGNKPRSGAGVGRGDSQTGRPYQPGGRIVYPALAEKRSEVIDQYEALVDRVLRSAGLK
jgi:HK97 gp10 family phage protein